MSSTLHHRRDHTTSAASRCIVSILWYCTCVVTIVHYYYCGLAVVVFEPFRHESNRHDVAARSPFPIRSGDGVAEPLELTWPECFSISFSLSLSFPQNAGVANKHIRFMKHMLQSPLLSLLWTGQCDCFPYRVWSIAYAPLNVALLLGTRIACTYNQIWCASIISLTEWHSPKCSSHDTPVCARWCLLNQR